MFPILFLLILGANSHSIAPYQSPPYQTTLDMISEQGYAGEKHLVESAGYWLELHRIVEGSGESQGVVLLNHGFLADSACWVYGRVGGGGVIIKLTL